MRPRGNFGRSVSLGAFLFLFISSLMAAEPPVVQWASVFGDVGGVDDPKAAANPAGGFYFLSVGEINGLIGAPAGAAGTQVHPGPLLTAQTTGLSSDCRRITAVP